MGNIVNTIAKAAPAVAKAISNVSKNTGMSADNVVKKAISSATGASKVYNRSSGGGSKSSSGGKGGGSTSTNTNATTNTISSAYQTNGKTSYGQLSNAMKAKNEGTLSQAEYNKIWENYKNGGTTPGGTVATGGSSGSGGLSGGSGSSSSPKVYYADASGKAPAEAQNGDYIVTSGGLFQKGTGLVDSSINRSNYSQYSSKYGTPLNTNAFGGTNNSAIATGVASGGSAPKVTTNYVGSITTEAGSNMYNDVLKNGVTRTTSDGATLFRGSDGKVYATTASGTTYAVQNNYAGQSTITPGTVQKVDISGNQNLATGLAQLKLGLSNSYTSDDGTTYTLNGDVIMATTKDGTTYAASIVGDMPKTVVSSDQIDDNGAILAKLIQNGYYEDGDIESTDKDANGQAQKYYEIHTTDGYSIIADASGRIVDGGTKVNYHDANGNAMSGFVGINDDGWLVVNSDASNKVSVWRLNPTGGVAADEDLTRHGFYIKDGRTYDVQNGLWVRYDDEIVPEDAVFKTNAGTWWDVNGNNAEELVAPIAQNLEMDDAFVNDLINEFITNYYNLVNPDNYESMTREQALARASEMLRANYDQSLENTLNNMNQKALNTGFFGQLPTEALKQQAAAANEVDFQTAINDLADQLYDTSYKESQDLFSNDRLRQQDQISYLQKILDAYNGYNNDEAANKVNALNSMANVLGTMISGANALASQTSLSGNQTMGDVSKLRELVDQLNDYYDTAHRSLSKYL